LLSVRPSGGQKSRQANNLGMEKHMEAELLRMHPLESQAGSILQNHFLRRRQTNEPINVTHEVTFIAHCALQWSPSSPVLLLKTMGIMFHDRVAAFNFSLVSGQLILCRARAIAAFRREGWADVPHPDVITVFVGANELKQWSAMTVPPGTELAEFLDANPKLMVTAQSFGLDHAPEEVRMGPGLPPKDVLSEPHFPLVSILFQQRPDSVWEVASYPPAPPKQRKLEYCLKSQITIDEQNQVIDIP
jgi:hypothetical protein